MLRRKIQKTIQDYYRSGSNKVLLLEGARQIGRKIGEQKRMEGSLIAGVLALMS